MSDFAMFEEDQYLPQESFRLTFKNLEQIPQKCAGKSKNVEHTSTKEDDFLDSRSSSEPIFQNPQSHQLPYENKSYLTQEQHSRRYDTRASEEESPENQKDDDRSDELEEEVIKTQIKSNKIIKKKEKSNKKKKKKQTQYHKTKNFFQFIIPKIKNQIQDYLYLYQKEFEEEFQKVKKEKYSINMQFLDYIFKLESFENALTYIFERNILYRRLTSSGISFDLKIKYLPYIKILEKGFKNKQIQNLN